MMHLEIDELKVVGSRLAGGAEILCVLVSEILDDENVDEVITNAGKAATAKLADVIEEWHALFREPVIEEDTDDK